MKLTKEKILNALYDNSLRVTIYGERCDAVPKDEWDAVAEQILSEQELPDEPQPQLQQANVMQGEARTIAAPTVEEITDAANAYMGPNSDITMDDIYSAGHFVAGATWAIQRMGGNGA